MSKAVRLVNGIGLGMFGDKDDRIRDIRVYAEGASVQLWIEPKEGRDYMQYLDPASAMAFAHAFERCAIAALRASTRLVED